ncbi:putative ribonuclease H-like domain-containing protein [Tanacetum coccineum]|uniref:Ribonuclease H-like domain-containing protein n=1 Tax=Tanacetum coccineum TaxID=301880 RepID=A0ABQ5AX85_9ASTR
MDERGIVIRNKGRLVAQGYTQEEWTDYDEVFAPVARIDAIRLFLAYASFKDFVVYQMDVKSVFLYGKIEEEVYVFQPLGFEDPDFLDRVYKVEKALYGLHQAPRAWSMIGFDVLTSSDLKSSCVVSVLDPSQSKGTCQETNSVANSIIDSEYVLTIKLLWTSALDSDLKLLDYGIYIAPSHTKKIFGNMRRIGKGFSGRVTPLFLTMVVHNQEEMGEGSTMPTDPHHTPTIIQPSTSQPKKTQKPRRPKKKDTQVPQPSGPTTNVADEAVNEEMDDSLERAATIASSLEAKQDSGGGPKRQETMGDIIAQTRSNNVSKLSNDPLLVKGNTLLSGEDSLKLQELMALCTTLQSRVLALETTKTTQANEIARDKEDLGEDASKQRRRIHDIDTDKDITLVNDDNDMFDVGTLTGDEVLVEQVVVAKDVNLSVDEVTLAQALAALKSAKVQEKGDVIKEPSVPVSAAKIEVDHELAQKLQAQEQEELSNAEKQRLFVQLLEKRRKHFDGSPKVEEQSPFANIQGLFDKAMKRVNAFIDYRTELVEESSKKAKTKQEITSHA